MRSAPRTQRDFFDEAVCGHLLPEEDELLTMRKQQMHASAKPKVSSRGLQMSTRSEPVGVSTPEWRPDTGLPGQRPAGSMGHAAGQCGRGGTRAETHRAEVMSLRAQRGNWGSQTVASPEPARYWGKAKVAIQALMTFLLLNAKRMIKLLVGKGDQFEAALASQ